MPIRLLPTDVASRIAAGEIVERPASVVKELVENSLDATATEISVEIRAGGVEYIRVTDNGLGIPSSQVEVAFQRFATSKVSDAEDLESISTLGFRGEALPSIAAVSSVSLVTRTAGEEAGVRLRVADGNVLDRERLGASTGTSVEVRNLFGSFPARRKFLRTVATEASRIQALVTRFALAYPEVRFRMERDGSEVFQGGGSGELREVIGSVYGLDVAEAMLELAPSRDAEDELEPLVWGMVGPPSLDRANRSYMSFFANRRWVQNRMLGFAVEQAYHGFMRERRYPLAVVNVTLPHREIDVNVHPAKSEVRFRREGRVFSAVQQAVRSALMARSPVPELTHSQRAAPHTSAAPRGPAFWPVQPFAGVAPRLPGEIEGPGATETDGAPPAEPRPSFRQALPVLRVLGQVQNTYIVAEGPDGMYLIDQHAAHERVVFERVRAEVSSQQTRSQSLLEPATVEITPHQQEVMQSQGGLVARLGFRIEPFGTDTFLLRGVPGLLSDGDPGQALLDVLDLMAEGGGFESWEERAAYSIACHSAIRAGKTLSHQEMSELVRQLEECRQPNTCPHGRPTSIHMSSGHLEREFGRR